jgi:hypothetical protein
MAKKEKTTQGKWMGMVAFIFIVLALTATYVIIIMNVKINLEYMYKIDLLAFGVFSIVWGAVFGSGITKKIQENKK